MANPWPQADAIAQAICTSRGFGLVRLVGTGAFKYTYLVQPKSGAQLALKILKPGNQPDRLDRELDALLRCKHPSIGTVQALDKFSTAGVQVSYFLEDFLGGGTLDNKLRQHGALHRDEVLRIGKALGSAVLHLRGLDLVHRDIKPANIMFASIGNEVVLVDFGLVRNLAETSITATAQIHGPGTPLFAPPEQLNNEKLLIDWRSDQFSLGVTLAIAALNMHPYAVPGDNQVQLIERVIRKEGPSQAFRVAAVAAQLDMLVQMVMPYPVQRFSRPQAYQAAWGP